MVMEILHYRDAIQNRIETAQKYPNRIWPTNLANLDPETATINECGLDDPIWKCDNCDEYFNIGIDWEQDRICLNCIKEAWNLLQGKKICERL